MSNRLDQEREAVLQPKRIQTAIDAVTKLGIEIEKVDKTSIQFTFKGEKVTYFPYSGWASGKSIQDGRGLEPLLKQLKQK